MTRNEFIAQTAANMASRWAEYSAKKSDTERIVTVAIDLADTLESQGVAPWSTMINHNPTCPVNNPEQPEVCTCDPKTGGE